MQLLIVFLNEIKINNVKIIHYEVIFSSQIKINILISLKLQDLFN